MKKLFIIVGILPILSTLMVCPEEKENSGQEFFFSINSLVGNSHFLGSYSEITNLYDRRIPKGFHPEDHNLRVDSNFEENIVIKKGMYVGLNDGESYSKIGQIDGFRFIVNEIHSHFFFQVKGSIYNRMLPQNGLFIISNDPIQNVFVYPKAAYTGEKETIINTVNEHLANDFNDLLSMFDRFDQAKIKKMSEKEIDGLIGNMRLNDVYEFKDSLPVKVAEGNLGDFGGFLIVIFDNGSYEFMANTSFRSFFSISDCNYMWIHSWVPSTGIMIDAIYSIENNELDQIFKEGGFST